MPETRYSEQYQDGKLVARIPYEVSDEQLAEEKEQDTFAKADSLIDGITSLADAKVFLKRLTNRLIKRGALP